MIDVESLTGISVLRCELHIDISDVQLQERKFGPMIRGEEYTVRNQEVTSNKAVACRNSEERMLHPITQKHMLVTVVRAK